MEKPSTKASLDHKVGHGGGEAGVGATAGDSSQARLTLLHHSEGMEHRGGVKEVLREGRVLSGLMGCAFTRHFASI